MKHHIYNAIMFILLPVTCCHGIMVTLINRKHAGNSVIWVKIRIQPNPIDVQLEVLIRNNARGHLSS